RSRHRGGTAMAINDGQQWGEYAYGDDFRTYERFGYPYGRYPYERFGYEGYGYEPRRKMGPGEHSWRGGVLGWLGAGIRAGAGWFGERLQQWGSWFGGRVRGGTEEIGRAVRGRGERMASALEEQDERAAASSGARRRRPQRYRRPDERPLGADELRKHGDAVGTPLALRRKRARPSAALRRPGTCPGCACCSPPRPTEASERRDPNRPREFRPLDPLVRIDRMRRRVD